MKKKTFLGLSTFEMLFITACAIIICLAGVTVVVFLAKFNSLSQVAIGPPLGPNNFVNEKSVEIARIEPLPTYTPFPTYTPLPTYTIAPVLPQNYQDFNQSNSSSVSSSHVGSFDHPVPVGSGYQYPGFGTLRILQNFSEPGRTGFAIVYLSFVCERPANQKCDTSDFMFQVIGKSGNGYDQKFDSAIPDPTFGSYRSPDIFGGGTEKGYIGFLITNPESSLLLQVSLFLEDGDIYMQIY